jgi:hypothetical protein
MNSMPIVNPEFSQFINYFADAANKLGRIPVWSNDGNFHFFPNLKYDLNTWFLTADNPEASAAARDLKTLQRITW